MHPNVFVYLALQRASIKWWLVGVDVRITCAQVASLYGSCFNVLLFAWHGIGLISTDPWCFVHTCLALNAWTWILVCATDWSQVLRYVMRRWTCFFEKAVALAVDKYVPEIAKVHGGDDSAFFGSQSCCHWEEGTYPMHLLQFLYLFCECSNRLTACVCVCVCVCS